MKLAENNTYASKPHSDVQAASCDEQPFGQSGPHDVLNIYTEKLVEAFEVLRWS
jgi:hypothetical protein